MKLLPSLTKEQLQKVVRSGGIILWLFAVLPVFTWLFLASVVGLKVTIWQVEISYILVYAVVYTVLYVVSEAGGA